MKRKEFKDLVNGTSLKNYIKGNILKSFRHQGELQKMAYQDCNPSRPKDETNLIIPRKGEFINGETRRTRGKII